MRMGDWSDAESYLQEAFEKDAKNPDTLANLLTVGLHLGKPVSRHREYAPASEQVIACMVSSSPPGSCPVPICRGLKLEMCVQLPFKCGGRPCGDPAALRHADGL